MRRTVTSWVLTAVLAAVLVTMSAWLLIDDRISWAALARDRDAMAGLVAAHPALAAAGYVTVYALSAVALMPVGALLMVAGGLLFGVGWGTALASAGATLGAALTFLIVRGVLGRRLLDGVARSPAMARVSPKLARDGVWFLIALRLVPMLPFAIVNVAPALAGMRFGPYLVGSAAGIVPTCFVFVSAGLAGRAALDAPSGATLMSGRVVAPLLALSVLSLVPAVLRARRPACAGVGDGTGSADDAPQR